MKKIVKQVEERPPSPEGPNEYPRPQLQRGNWISLNGLWNFHIDFDAALRTPADVTWDATIRVPFAPETAASGIGDTRLFQAVWYRRTFDAPVLADGQRLLLHFGAVDYEATLWLNGQLIGAHEGGYTPFHVDITDALAPEGKQTIVVRAFDDPADLAKPRGKQDWQPKAHSIWYDRTTGIWQPVWMEVVAASYLASLRWAPDAIRWSIGVDVRLAGRARNDLRLRITLHANGQLLADDIYGVTSSEVYRHIGLIDPGIDDARAALLWHPDHPVLIDAELQLLDSAGVVLDHVTSYTALRSISLLGDRFVLNGKPYPLRLVLDQGYWPEGGLTPPDDDAFRRDVELVKAMGFNGVRLHQKIENPRFLYWADRLGLLVWGEMPSAYRFSQQTVQRITRQWTDAVLRDVSHPCIVAWVPINESWSVPDLPDSPAQRHFLEGLYHLTKSLDPTRPVIGNDGWEAAVTDIIAIHDYDADANRIAQRYSAKGPEGIADLLRRERPGYKVLTLADFRYRDQPIMLTEFGGIAFSERVGSWGYSRAETADIFARQYFALLEAVRSLPLLRGFCYTQFTDAYQEANGLLYVDRTPKIPLSHIATATRGPRTPDDRQIETTWRSQLMHAQRDGKPPGPTTAVGASAND